MKPDIEKITKEIQVLVGPAIIVELPINEAEYIAGQTGEYRKLAIDQAAQSRLLRANVNQDVINYFQERIYNRGKELGVNSTTVQDNTQCKACGDTGWIVSYGPGTAEKYPCGCPKGKGKHYNLLKFDDIVTYGTKVIEPSVKENKLSPVLPVLPEVKGRKFR